MEKELELLKSIKREIKNGYDFEYLLANTFDDNYYGDCKLRFGKQQVEVESIWTDSDGHVMIHVDSPYYEGDVYMTSISTKNQLRIIDMIENYIKEDEE